MISEHTQPSPVRLTATNKFGSSFTYDLSTDQGVFIGCSSNCGLQLDGEGLSDIQCRIGFEEGDLWIHPWMSAEGTRVNGKPIDGGVVVKIGDVVEIGDHEIAIAPADGKPSSAPSQFNANQEESSPPTSGQAVNEIGDLDHEDETTSLENAASFDSPENEVSDHFESIGRHADEPSFDSEESSESMDFNFFDIEEEETYDRETVALLQAEIEELQSQLARRDAERDDEPSDFGPADTRNPEASDEVLQRMQELIDEANRSDERVALLEEMLHAAEETSRSEGEERSQLEAWVGDIEKRIGQREEEHEAELDALRQRLDESQEQQSRLQRQLHQAAAAGGAAPKQYEETLENLQQQNRELKNELADSQKQCRGMQSRIDQNAEETEASLRAERANIAKEQAKISRLRYELSSKLSAIEEVPKTNHADRETSERISTLRQHLREIHAQEKKEEKEASLTTRLAKLWKRVEY